MNKVYTVTDADGGEFIGVFTTLDEAVRESSTTDSTGKPNTSYVSNGFEFGDYLDLIIREVPMNSLNYGDGEVKATVRWDCNYITSVININENMNIYPTWTVKVEMI